MLEESEREFVRLQEEVKSIRETVRRHEEDNKEFKEELKIANSKITDINLGMARFDGNFLRLEESIKNGFKDYGEKLDSIKEETNKQTERLNEKEADTGNRFTNLKWQIAGSVSIAIITAIVVFLVTNSFK